MPGKLALRIRELVYYMSYRQGRTSRLSLHPQVATTLPNSWRMSISITSRDGWACQRIHAPGKKKVPLRTDEFTTRSSRTCSRPRYTAETIMPLSIISVSIRHVAAVDNKCVDEAYATVACGESGPLSIYKLSGFLDNSSVLYFCRKRVLRWTNTPFWIFNAVAALSFSNSFSNSWTFFWLSSAMTIS